MRIRANAKINLSLTICGKRQDGYHLIDTVMHSVSLYNLLEIEKADTITVQNSVGEIPAESNLSYKAAKQFFTDYGITGGADIKIKENIPMSAGLGSGSANAAAVLVALRKLYKSDISDAELSKTASKVGADIPFLISGGCKRATGIGEVLTDLKPLKSGWFLLCKAEEKSSTKEMYRILDSKDYKKCDTQGVIKAIENNDIASLSKNIYNAFSEIWNDSFVKKELLSTSPCAVSLSGSGPTWFAIYDTEESALKAKEVMESKNLKCFLATPLDKSVIIE